MGHRVDPSVEAFRALASRWLAAPCAWGGLNPAEACTVALYLSPQTLWPGEVLVQEGDAVAVDRLWLVLAGEVSVQSQALQLEAAGMVVRVMGPGSWIGELSLLDGGP
ncbi:cyclic nucleotide-binding domain-containing protein, partial [Aquabacterium sp. A08]|uniref:cyclic nucleotide-binding domain-containing protein n=1 Tax=Aquabacterium sp. A08 TaxID=2718532 RepID=UPI00141FC9CA